LFVLGRLRALELAAARLAAQGLTPREIGRRLHVTVRTAESQLKRTHAKLAISGKSELATRFSGL
jgi:DNA-binding CsgD family transcriptional regulator